MKIALGADHAGFKMKQDIKEYLISKGLDVVDVGTYDGTISTDYPDYAIKAAELVSKKEAEFGIVFCGTGLGVAMAANKVSGIRAVPIETVEFSKLSRQHNNANVLALSGRFIDIELNKKIVDVFLSTPFEGGRHERRTLKIGQYEKGTNK
jgi:ribose 5-phosphate isomerase B